MNDDYEKEQRGQKIIRIVLVLILTWLALGFLAYLVLLPFMDNAHGL